jgi:hypothetical protein
MNDLRLAFRNFLDRAQDESWIVSFDWYVESHFAKLREKMQTPQTPELFSKTHKKATDGQWWGLKVESAEDTAIGVDMEILIDRPILKNTDWIIRRLNLPRTSTPKQILEEWSCREAAYKCLAPDNAGLLLPQIRKSTGSSYYVQLAGREITMQTRLMWRDNWLLALAWRSRT